MRIQLDTIQRSRIYCILGFLLGISAPLGWTAVRLLFFRDDTTSLMSQIFLDFIKSPFNFALYTYMGLGTALVLASLGYFIGKANDELMAKFKGKAPEVYFVGDCADPKLIAELLP